MCRANLCLLFHRQQDVRATEIDKVDMHQSFHAGDIVRAMVVSLCLCFTLRFSFTVLNIAYRGKTFLRFVTLCHSFSLFTYTCLVI